MVQGQGYSTVAAGALCGTHEISLDIFGELETAGHRQSWHLYFIHGLDLRMPYVLVLTQISPDEEVLPLHRGGTQAWANVYAAQDLA